MSKTSSVFVAIVGRPNVGKSSLLNRFIGGKVAIVSPKPQTTRNRITGVLTQEELQYVFIDTPGLHNPKTKLSEYMVKQIHGSVADVDVALLVTEPLGEIQQSEKELITRFSQLKLPAVLAINKIDLVAQKDKLLKKIEAFSNLYPFDAVVPVSALGGDGIELLLAELAKHEKEGPHYFDDASITDQPERVLIAEIIREKLLFNMQEEIPHGTAVMIEQMTERPGGKMVDISAVILCEKDNHKGMIIGKSGSMLKKIASQARGEIEHFLGVKVNLQCWVKIKPDWRNKMGVIRELGYYE